MIRHEEQPAVTTQASLGDARLFSRVVPEWRWCFFRTQRRDECWRL